MQRILTVNITLQLQQNRSYGKDANKDLADALVKLENYVAIENVDTDFSNSRATIYGTTRLTVGELFVRTNADIGRPMLQHVRTDYKLIDLHDQQHVPTEQEIIDIRHRSMCVDVDCTSSAHTMNLSQ